MRKKEDNTEHTLTAEVVLCCQFDSPHYDFKQLKAAVQSAADEANKLDTRLDIVFTPPDDAAKAGEIPAEIKEAIKRAGIVILEISDLNPNVLVELGLAWQADRTMILLREEQASTALPFNIHSLRWESYRRDRLEQLEARLTRNISECLGSLPLDQLIQDVEHLVEKFFRVVSTTDDLMATITDQLDRCEQNFYYIGSAGLAARMEESLDLYRKYLGGISSHRVVNMQSLKDLRQRFADIKTRDLANHCVWLARYHQLVAEETLSLYHSDAIGQSGKGMSLLVFDQEEVDLVLGRLLGKFNHKAFVLASERAGSVAYDYAKNLVHKSEEIEAEELGPYFTLNEPVTKVPPAIAEAGGADLETLWHVCREYVESQ